MQSELTFALKSVEELKQGLSSAGQAAVIARREAEQARKAAQHVGDGSTERVTEVFQQILGLAAARNNQQPARRPSVTAAPVRPEPVKREPRHGFDDAAAPMAVLGLDGKFKELNPAFTKLVGYKEHEFTKAAWPSPHDRRDYKEQLEQLRQMGIGELRDVDVQSTYMHGQGLMVPVVGKLTLETGRRRSAAAAAARGRGPIYELEPSGPLARMPDGRRPSTPSGNPPGASGPLPGSPCSANARTHNAQLKTAHAPRLIALPAARAARCPLTPSSTPSARRTSSRANRWCRRSRCRPSSRRRPSRSRRSSLRPSEAVEPEPAARARAGARTRAGAGARDLRRSRDEQLPPADGRVLAVRNRRDRSRGARGAARLAARRRAPARRGPRRADATRTRSTPSPPPRCGETAEHELPPETGEHQPPEEIEARPPVPLRRAPDRPADADATPRRRPAPQDAAPCAEGAEGPAPRRRRPLGPPDLRA